MKIQQKCVVLATYELTVGSGEIVDKATEAEPFAFIHGVGMTLEAFDERLIGLEAGDTFDFNLTAEQAYGAVNEEDVVEVPREVFKEMPEADLVVGLELPMSDNEGNQYYGTVQAVNNDIITMDFNHPLSGQGLHFKGKIIEVRLATADELGHGHVHGPGGHQH